MHHATSVTAVHVHHQHPLVGGATPRTYLETRSFSTQLRDLETTYKRKSTSTTAAATPTTAAPATAPIEGVAAVTNAVSGSQINNINNNTITSSSSHNNNNNNDSNNNHNHHSGNIDGTNEHNGVSTSTSAIVPSSATTIIADCHDYKLNAPQIIGECMCKLSRKRGGGGYRVNS